MGELASLSISEVDYGVGSLLFFFHGHIGLLNSYQFDFVVNMFPR